MKGKWIDVMTAFALLAAWGATVQADPPPPTLWTTRVGSSSVDYAHAIALDGTGNIYITGPTNGDLGGPNKGEGDVYVVKVDSGGTVQWARQFGSNRDDHAGGVAIDGSGNSYITGYTDAIYPEPRYAFIVKYDSGGTEQWTRQISTGADEGGTGIAVDSSDSNYISGWTTGDLAAPCQGPSDAFIAKHDSGGTVQWIRQIGTSAGENAWGIGVDAGANSYITGSTNGDLGGPNQGESDVYVVKFDSGGTEQWARQIGTSEREWVDGITVDTTGNSYITGFTAGDMAGPNQGSSDAFIVKYDSGGTEQWVRQIGTWGTDRAYGVAVDGSGNVYIAGHTEGDLAGPNQGGQDIFIIKYDSGGTEQWRRQMGGTRSDGARGIGLDANGNIYITGGTSGDLWGPDYGDADAFIMALGNTAAPYGDATLDGCVDGLDYVVWSNNYQTGTWWVQGDFNEDGVVDGLDYILWSSNYKVSCPSAVPEPVSALPFALGVFALRRRRAGQRS